MTVTRERSKIGCSVVMTLLPFSFKARGLKKSLNTSLPHEPNFALIKSHSFVYSFQEHAQYQLRASRELEYLRAEATEQYKIAQKLAQEMSVYKQASLQEEVLSANQPNEETWCDFKLASEYTHFDWSR